MKKFTFILKNTEFQRQLNFNHLTQMADNVRDALFSSEKYEVQSDVDIQNFKSFLDYYAEQIPLPTINSDNIFDFRQLSKEFNILTDYFSSSEYDSIYKMSVLKNAESSDNKDRSQCEEFISQNLDFFLSNYSSEMGSLPLNSLYNIFYNKNRKLKSHKEAYLFITKQEHKSDIFVLLNSLDCSELDDEMIDDSISKREERFGFSPLFSIERYKQLSESKNIIESQQSKLKEFESTIESQQSKLKEFESTIESQQSKLKELESTSKAQQLKMKEYEATIASLKHELSIKPVVNVNKLLIREGVQARVRKGAKQYGKHEGFAPFVYDRVFVVKEVNGDRAVIYKGQTCIGAIHIDDLKPP